jgi:Ca2+-transporting ATPase
VGVSLGQRGTPVARAAADLVLLHDDFGALCTAVREGRRIFANLVRAFLYLIGFHVPIVALAVLVPLLGVPPLLMPVHLVWLELIVHPVSALVFEGGSDPGVMDRAPRRAGEQLLQALPLTRALVCGALITVGALYSYLHGLPGGEAHARSAALVVVVFGGICLAIREHAGPLTARGWLVLGLSALSLPLALAIPALKLAPLSMGDWALSLALGAAAVAWRIRTG